MKKVKYIIFGIIIGIFISFGTGFAKNVLLEIEQIPLKYYFNGQEKSPADGEQGFIYNNRTYVPIRFVSESLNKDVQWNGENNSILIKDKDADSFTYIVEDNKLFTVRKIDYVKKEIKVDELKNFQKLLSDAKLKVKDERDIGLFGIYKDNLLFSVLYATDENADYAMFKYNLKNDTYEFMQNAPYLLGGYGNHLVENKFIIADLDNLCVYNLDDVNSKDVKVNLAYASVSLIFHDDYAYFFNADKFEKKDYTLYKQKIGENKATQVVIFPIGGYLIIRDGWIYCLNYDDQKTVYRVRLDGTGLEKSYLLQMMGIPTC